MTHFVKLFSSFLIAAAILLSVNLLFFSPLLSGHVLLQNDMVNYAGMSHEARQYFENTGSTTYWTNAEFGGMPTYQIYSPPVRNLFDHILNTITLGFEGTLHYYFYLSFGAFLALALLGLGPWISLLGAFVISFATNHIGLVASGHLTKIGALGLVPMIWIGTFLLFDKRWKLGFLMFTCGLAGSIHMNHIQMTYYASLLVALYVLLEVLYRMKTKQWKTLTRPLAALITGSVIAICINFFLLMSMHSYVKDTMRGGAILSASTDKKIITESSATGLGWDYAMSWSEGFTDLLSIAIPGAVGGSSNEIWSETSDMGTALKKNGTPINGDFKLPMYWGSLPYTDSPDYACVLVLLLFLLGLVLMQGTLKWFAVLGTIAMILISLGSNLPWFNKFLFDHFPYFSKFRAPNSILNLLTILMPLFGMIALSKFIDRPWDHKSLVSLFKKTVLPMAGFFLIIAVAGPSLFDMTTAKGDPTWKTNTVLYKTLLLTRGSYLRNDALRSFLILLAGAGLMYAFGIKKIKLNDFLMSFGLLIALDLWMVDKRYLNATNFQPEPLESSIFKPRPVDQQILRDTGLSYRVLDLSINTYSSAISSYHHKTIGGHQAAKLRRYQDMIDYYFSKKDTTALNMMNTKYIIDEKQGLHLNASALGNAWFIDTVITVRTPDEEIASIKFLQPAGQAIYLASDFGHLSIPLSYHKNGRIELTRYAPNQLQYMSQTNDQQLAVFSEVWYGPDKGWHATIDGQPAKHFRVNYLLRAMLVPAGNHTIEFTFAPDQIKRNQLVSTSSGTLFGLILLISIGFGIKDLVRKTKETADSAILSPAQAKAKQK